MEQDTANIFPGFMTSESLNGNWGGARGVSNLKETILSDTDSKCGTTVLATEQVYASLRGAPPEEKMATKERITSK